MPLGRASLRMDKPNPHKDEHLEYWGIRLIQNGKTVVHFSPNTGTVHLVCKTCGLVSFNSYETLCSAVVTTEYSSSFGQVTCAKCSKNNVFSNSKLEYKAG